MPNHSCGSTLWNTKQGSSAQENRAPGHPRTTSLQENPDIMVESTEELVSVDNIEALRNEWKKMFQEILPTAAKSAQPKWPVHVDHCFARIILDSTVGIDTPWMVKVQTPAYRHMSREQLKASVQLGEQIINGDIDIIELNNKSLALRGKAKSGKLSRDEVKALASQAPKRKVAGEQESLPKKMRKRGHEGEDAINTKDLPKQMVDNNTSMLLTKIAKSSSTPFQKRVLSALMQVPRGQYTTYGILAKYLQSNARAVGSGLRNNPFAPQVPCHRVLASGGGIGGFKGSWGKNGKEGLNDAEKRGLLRDEGVRFDGSGRVVGRSWEGFQ